MRAFLVVGLLALAMVAAFLPAYASPLPAPLSFADVSDTSRVSPELNFRMAKPLSARAEATLLMPIDSDRPDNAGYRTKTRFQSGRAMMKFYPFEGGFYFAGGARLDRTDGRTRSVPGTAVRLGNNFVSASGRVVTQRAAQESSNFTPAFSMGYGAAIRSNISLGFEAGALFGARDSALGDRYLRAADSRHGMSPMVSMKLGYRF